MLAAPISGIQRTTGNSGCTTGRTVSAPIRCMSSSAKRVKYPSGTTKGLCDEGGVMNIK